MRRLLAVIFAALNLLPPRFAGYAAAEAHGKFGTVINCIDGRAQAPAAQWLKEHYHLDFVDTITEPGPDKVISSGPAETIEAIKRKVLISINAHHSGVVAIAGHYDCAANPVDEKTHIREIRDSVKAIHAWKLPVEVVGLWINSRWEAQRVTPELSPVSR